MYVELLKLIKAEHINNIRDFLLHRENENPFDMGGGIAFPHGRINLIKTPIVAIGLSPKKGIPFPSKSGKRKILTYLIFMLLLPSSDYPVNIVGKSKQYINAISSVAKFLRTIKSKKLVKSFKSESDFLEFVGHYLEEDG